MKTYIIKITDSTGMEHHHLIEDENDLQILKAVLNRVEKLATQKVNELSQADVIKSVCECTCENSIEDYWHCRKNCTRNTK